MSRHAIAAAAHEIGLQDLTLKSVAEHLGVSISGLYHHVKGKEDLLRLAAEHSLALGARPADRGQHWAVWLFEWATYIQRSFVADPGLLRQYLDGGIGVDTIIEYEEEVVAVLVRHGVAARDALASFHLVSALALGWAVFEIRERRARETGRSQLVDVAAVLADRAPGDLPHLRQLVGEGGNPLVSTFTEQAIETIAGLALRRGDDVVEVLAALRQP